MKHYIFCLIFIALFMQACSDNPADFDPSSDVEVYLVTVDDEYQKVEESDILYIQSQDQNRRFALYGDIGNWTVVARVENQITDIFPREGYNDGLFFVYLTQNEGESGRETSVSVINSHGLERFTIHFYQFGSLPEIFVVPQAEIDASGGPMTIRVYTNTDWTVDDSSLPSWISQSVKVQDAYQFTIATNDTGSDRSTVLKFICTSDSTIYSETIIKQKQ